MDQSHVAARAKGRGSHERGQVQYHILPVRGLKKKSGGRAFSSKGRMWNADHRLEESTIQTASLPCVLSGRGGICQVKTAANVFWGAWNTEKENRSGRCELTLITATVILCRDCMLVKRSIRHHELYNAYVFNRTWFNCSMRKSCKELGSLAGNESTWLIHTICHYWQILPLYWSTQQSFLCSNTAALLRVCHTNQYK